jgi:nucleotide-binding universal stress UspA family protein
MAKIILATDYSPVAQNAAGYALKLADFIHADLELVHAYVIPFAYTDSPVPLLNVEEMQEIAEKSMAAEMQRLGGLSPDIRITYDILPGDIMDCLTEKIEKEQPQLIVVGTSGQGSDSFLWGSVAVKALRTLPVPVLAVPDAMQWTPVTKLCFAADYAQLTEKTPMDEIATWAKLLGAELFVLHVNQDAEKTAPNPFLIETLKDCNPSYHSIINENVEDGVHHFLQNQKIDWLLVIPKKYGFFESLFHKSRTKMLTEGSPVPVLSLHKGEKV